MAVIQLDLGALCPPPGGSLEDAPLITLAEIPKCAGKMVVADTETIGLYAHKGDHPIGLALYCPQAGVEGYIPLIDKHDIAEAARLMSEWPADTQVVNHNIKFDLHMLGLRPRAMPWRNNFYDTMSMAHLLDSRGAPRADGSWHDPKDERGRFNLVDLSRHYLRDESKAEYLKKMQGVPHHEWPIRILSRYAVEDCRLTYRLANTLGPRLRQHGQLELLDKVMQFLGVIWDTENYGLQLDLAYMEKVDQIVARQRAELEEELFSNPRINKRFNWESHTELSRMMYEHYGWPRPVNPFSEETRFKTSYTKTGTSSFLLVEKAKHPLGTLILQLRGLAKLQQFTEQWRNLMDPNGVIHSSFNMAFVRTGRLSSSEPNMQQLPSDARSNLLTNVYEDADKLMEFFAETNLRKAFVAREGNSLLGVDYKQQEIRLFAAISKDENLLAAITSGDDIHASIAEKIWGQRINPWRDWAKVVSFGILYGMTVGSLEFRLNKPREEAYKILHDYWDAFPRVKPYMAEIVESMKARGYATYWSGRRYYRDDPTYQYKAVNAIVQGGAADMLMEACVDIADWFEREGIPGRIVNYVHDEVDIELPEELIGEYAPIISKRMEMPHLLGLPFLTDIKIGPNLGDLKEVKQQR